MIRSSLPFNSVTDSYYERLGIDFGFHLRGTRTTNLGDNARGVFGLGPGGQLRPNLTFTQGSNRAAIPPFGNYDPASDATFGYNVRNGSGGYHLGFNFGKGRTRTITNTTPVIMTRNGVTGSLFNGTATPFVTGVVPIVGNSMVPNLGSVNYVSPLELKLRQLHMESRSGIAGSSPTVTGGTANDVRRSSTPRTYGNLSSSAARGDLSIEEIKRQRQQKLEQQKSASNAKSLEYLEKSNSALKLGRDAAARSYLRAAIRYASENERPALQKRLDQLLLEK